MNQTDEQIKAEIDRAFAEIENLDESHDFGPLEWVGTYLKFALAAIALYVGAIIVILSL